MNMEVGRTGQIGVQTNAASDVGRLGGRTLTLGQAAGARAAATTNGGLLSGVKALGARILDAITPAGVRVSSKAARADVALAKGMDRSLQALTRGGSEGVQAFRNELMTLRKGERAMGRGGLDFDATLQTGLKNRLAGLSDQQLQAVMTSLQSSDIGSFRERLIDGPSERDRVLIERLNASGIGPGVPADELTRPDVLRDLSIFESLVLDEAVSRSSAQGADAIDVALNNALKEVGREAEGVRGAVAYVLPTACQAARHTIAELRSTGALPEAPTRQQTESADTDRAFGLVKTRLEAMGGETRAMLLRYADSEQLQQLQRGTPLPGQTTVETDRALTSEISQRSDRLSREFNRGVERLIEGMPPNPGNAAEFVKTLRDTTETLRTLQQHAQVFSLDISHIDETIGQLLSGLDEVNSQMLGLESLENTQIRDLASCMKRLGVAHLDAGIGTVISARNEAARESYKSQCDVFMVSVASRDFTSLPTALQNLQNAAQEVLDIANELGGRIEGADKVSPFRAELLDEALAAYSNEQLLAVSGNMRSDDYVSATNTLQDAGLHLVSSINERSVDLGRTTLDLGLSMGMLDEAIAQTLEQRGQTVTALPQTPDTPTAAAKSLLRATCGLEPRGDSFTLTATTLPASSPRDLSVTASASRMLDQVARSPLDPDALLESCFTFNQVFAMSRSELQTVDADERQGGMEQVMLGLLNHANAIQLEGLRDNLASPVFRNLIEGVSLMRFGDRSDVGPVSDEILYAIGRLGAATESLEVLRVLVGEQAQARGLPPARAQLDSRLTSLEQLMPGNRTAIDQALDSITRLDTVTPGSFAAQPVSTGFQTIFSDMFLAPPTGSQFTEAVDGSGLGRGVAEVFVADLGRASMTVEQNGDKQTLFDRSSGMPLPESEIQARKQQAIERLQAFCGDDAQALALSRYLNQGALAPLAVGLMAPDMTIPGTSLPMANLVRGSENNQVGFDVQKLDGDRYQVEYTVSWSLIGLDGDDGMVPLNPNSSALTMRFSAEINLSDPDTPALLPSPVTFDLDLARGISFEVR